MTLLLSHIPKTAGTSLRRLVEKCHPDVVFAYHGELSLLNPQLDFVNSFRSRPGGAPSVLMGHFSYGVHRLLQLQPTYATVLRHPLDRVVSLYRYQKSLPDSRFAHHFQQQISLREFVQRGLTEMTNNHACRVIAGIAPDAGMLINERWLLDLALHNLQRHYLLVGTLDNLSDFLAALGARLHWPPLAFPKENVTMGPTLELDSTTRDCILEHNALDLALYQHVLATGQAHAAQPR